MKNFKIEELTHELLLTTRQKIRIWNAFATNIEAQFSTIIQSRGFLGALLGKLAGQLMKVPFALTKNILAPLTTIASSSAINKATQINIPG